MDCKWRRRVEEENVWFVDGVEAVEGLVLEDAHNEGVGWVGNAGWIGAVAEGDGEGVGCLVD